MQKYIGVKIIHALPMLLAAALAQGVRLSSSSTHTDDAEGYLVKYEDGYTSWSPKEVFDKAYRKTNSMSFGLAIEAKKLGYKVARAGWNGKGMWIALGDGSTALEAEKFWNPHSRAHAEKMGGTAEVSPYIIFKTADDKIQMGWQPSQADVLADDWMIVE